MKGRPPVPTVLKLLHGTQRSNRVNRREPMPGALSPECPAALTDPLARAEWEARIVPAITRRQITSADYAAALRHCELFAEWRGAWAEAQKHPRIITVGKQPQPNPYRTEVRKICAELWKVDAELGFTPASRTRVQTSGGSQDGVTQRWAGLLT